MDLQRFTWRRQTNSSITTEKSRTFRKSLKNSAEGRVVVPCETPQYVQDNLKIHANRLTTLKYSSNISAFVCKLADGKTMKFISSFPTHNEAQVPLTKKCVFIVSTRSLPCGKLNFRYILLNTTNEWKQNISSDTTTRRILRTSSFKIMPQRRKFHSESVYEHNHIYTCSTMF